MVLIYTKQCNRLCVTGLDKGECTEEEIEKVKSMVPKSLESYVERKLRIHILFN